MKNILITQRLSTNREYFEEREMLDVRWGKLFERIGFLPIVLPYKYDFKKYFSEVRIDGILLTGGNDLSSLNPTRLSILRDNTEFQLIDYAIQNSIPLLGICRGMQIISKYFSASFKEVDEQINIRHGLVVNQKSKYKNYLNKIKNVNSFHTYRIDNISGDFLISAYNEDGIIKAIEHKKHKIFGQMWHTERNNPFNEFELELMKGFFQ